MENEKIKENIVTYITGDLDAKTRDEMKREININGELKEQVEDYSRLWEDSAQLSQFADIDVNKDWKAVRQRMGFETKSKKIPFRRYMLRISAILILAFGLAYILKEIVNQTSEMAQTDYIKVVAANEKKVVNLSDGTELTLNIGSSIFYNNDFNATNRDVILEGEAFFDVSRNEKLPFKVFASNSTIQVLGTSFNINNAEEEVHLQVVSGKVAFYETANKENRIELVKDEMISYNSEEHMFAEKKELNPNFISWKTGRLEFKDVPLEEIFGTVANYFSKELVLELNDEFSESVTATFDNQSLEEILELIDFSVKQDFSASIEEDRILISN